MSQFSIYISVPDYLHQWLKNEYWNPETARVEFPRGSAPRAVMQSLLSKCPRVDISYHDHSGEIPVEVPTFKGINPRLYNHLPEAGKKALVSTIKRMFHHMMWRELSPLFTHDVQITDVIYAFMDRHGIERTEKNWETIRQMYHRMRKKTALQES